MIKNGTFMQFIDKQNKNLYPGEEKEKVDLYLEVKQKVILKFPKQLQIRK